MNDFPGFDDTPTPTSSTPAGRKDFVPVGQLRGDIPKDTPSSVENPTVAAVVLHSEEEAEEPSLAPEETLPAGEGEAPSTSSRKARNWIVPLAGVGVAAILAGSGFLILNPTPPPLPVAIETPKPTPDVTPEPAPVVVEPEPTPPVVVEEPVAEETEVLVEPEPELAPEVTYDNVKRVIGFKPDQATLTKEGKKTLKAIAKSVPSGTSVDVYGYVWEGTPGSSFTLDTARAQTVAKFLRKQGVTVGTVEGKGKKQRGVVVAWMKPVVTP